MKQAHGHKLGMEEALQPLCLAQGAFLVEADSLPSLKGHHSTTRNWIVGIGQKEQASGQELTCGEQLQGHTQQFSYNLHNQPRGWLPFQILEPIGAGSIQLSPGKVAHIPFERARVLLSPWSLQRRCGWVSVSWPAYCLVCATVERKQNLGCQVWEPCLLGIHPALLWTPEDQDTAGPRIQETEEWAYGLWSFSQVGWQLNIEWCVGFWWRLGGLPLAPQHFTIFSFWQLSFFSGLYFHSVQIVQASNQHRIPMSSSPLIQAPHILIKITTSSFRKNMLYVAFNILSG